MVKTKSSKTQRSPASQSTLYGGQAKCAESKRFAFKRTQFYSVGIKKKVALVHHPLHRELMYISLSTITMAYSNRENQNRRMKKGKDVFDCSYLKHCVTTHEAHSFFWYFGSGLTLVIIVVFLPSLSYSYSV